jgi:biotin carboxyl carrier protein
MGSQIAELVRRDLDQKRPHFPFFQVRKQFSVLPSIEPDSVAKPSHLSRIGIRPDLHLSDIILANQNAASEIIKSKRHGCPPCSLVKKGDHVINGQNIVVIEAMKMETVTVAPPPGAVESVYVKRDRRLKQLSCLQG